MSEIINNIVTTLIAYGADNLMPILIFVFVVATILKILMYHLLKSEYNFTSAFETRTHRYLNKEYPEEKKLNKFSDVVGFILNKTFEESYTARKIFRKRKEDSRVIALNRVFLVETGAQSLIDDTLKQTKYHDAGRTPDFDGIAKYAFNSNPYFNKLWGVIPIGLMNNVFSRLPSLFIIGGIFGTFLGISKGLPALKAMDPGNIVAAQATLESFLESMTLAMYSSVVGIFLSVCFTLMNTFMSFNTVYLSLVDRFTQSLELLWKETSTA